MAHPEKSITPRKPVFAEATGMLFEHSGLSRTARSILGWLLVAEPPHQSNT